MKEEWRLIEGYEDRYAVSNTGKVYSVKRDKVLKPKTDRYGYYCVCLYNGTNKHIPIHRLVANAFVDKVEGCDIVNHLDCNKKNNNAENLEWTTVQGNTKHAYDNEELFRNRVKQLHEMGVEARRIKIDAYFNGEYIGSFDSKKETAEKLGVSEKTIYNRLNNHFSTRSGYFFVKRGELVCQP